MDKQNLHDADHAGKGIAPIVTAMIWAGITPPAGGSRKTTCPLCSHTRAKPDQKCVSVYYDPPGAHCHHCAKTWEFDA